LLILFLKILFHNFMSIIFIQIISLFIFINLFYLFAIIKKRNDIADVAWGLGFILLSGITLIYNYNLESILVFALVSFWGIRLSSHILKKFLKKDEEDSRYKKWRSEWGAYWPLFSWLKVFMLQGVLLFVVAAPIITLAQEKDVSVNFWTYLGVAVWVFGITYEIIGDRQLKKFISNKKDKNNKIMKSGLWKYSRHPNYFGEAVLWWGIWLIAFGEYFWISIVGPLTIFFLLRFVSGVPMAEEGYRKDEEFQEYKKKTPAMFPNFLIK